MAWFSGKSRRADFDVWNSGSFDLVKQIEAVPLDLIPKGKARDQLLQEARDGGHTSLMSTAHRRLDMVRTSERATDGHTSLNARSAFAMIAGGVRKSGAYG